MSGRPGIATWAREQLPTFTDDNAGPLGCPSREQIRQRTEAIRAVWCPERRAQAQRRDERLRSPELISGALPYTQRGLNDAELMRLLLDVDDDPYTENLKEYHAKRRAMR